MKKYALSMLALLSIATPAFADGIPSTAYRKVGAWDIMIDDTLGHGCFIFASYPSGDILRVGIDNTKSLPTAYMYLGNPAWQSLVPGNPYTVSIAFDNTGTPFEWHGVARVISDGYKLLSFSFDNAEFMRALADHASIQVFYQGHKLVGLNLPGAQAALQTLVECQHQFPTGTGTATSTPDPFKQ